MIRFVSILTAVILAFCSPTLSTPAAAQTLVYVDAVNGLSTPSGPNPGDSWTNAFIALQDGIARAQALATSGHVIVRVRGFTTISSSNTYYPDVGSGQTNDLASSRFELSENVTILGNYIGGTGGDADNRDPTYLTVLSGDIGALNTATDNAWHVVYAPSGLARNANGTAHIRGCVIRDGYADGGSANNNGGGVFIETNAEPYLRDCVITSNHADGEGGGIWQRTGTDLLLRSCTISDNDAIFGGGFSGGSTAEATRA